MVRHDPQFKETFGRALIAKTIGYALTNAQGDVEPLESAFPWDAGTPVTMEADLWDELLDAIGIDLDGIFRRRRAVPFILFPRHVAAKHESLEKDLIYRKLQQAGDAFVLGLPLASLALMRSIMEAVLRDNYGALGADLSEAINSVRKKLPRGANEDALHRLRMRANAVLHGTMSSKETVGRLEPRDLEGEVLSLLFTLRALIEGAPQFVTSR
jgi:hypothetical protein